MATVNREEVSTCPICGRACPMDAPSCGRGKRLAEQLAAGPVDLEEFRKEGTQDGDGRRQSPHGHGEGHRHGHGDHGHGHHGHDHEKCGCEGHNCGSETNSDPTETERKDRH